MKILLFANTEWYLYNFRRTLAMQLRDDGHEVLLVSPPGPFGQRLAELGFRWIPAPMERRSLNPLRELLLVGWLCRLMIRERVDVFHGFTIKCAVYGSMAARWTGVSARISAIAGLGYVYINDNFKSRALRWVLSRLLRVALNGQGARVILQNPDDVAYFANAKLLDNSQVRLIPSSGVDCQRFAPLAQGRQPAPANAPFRVLLAARLLWDKGIAEFVEAARLLRAQGRNIEFLLAGEPDSGNPAAITPAVIHGWVGEGLVRWLGHVEDMPELFRSVDVAVLPSYREGLPKGLIEAGACGLPLVTTDAPGCREVVAHEIDGLLIPVKDARALAQAIAKLQDDVPLRRQLGAAAREKITREFDERKVIARTIAVYREILPI